MKQRNAPRPAQYTRLSRRIVRALHVPEPDQGLVELAVLLPVPLVLLLRAIDLGRWHSQITGRDSCYGQYRWVMAAQTYWSLGWRSHSRAARWTVA